jgi:hypothetical protein
VQSNVFVFAPLVGDSLLLFNEFFVCKNLLLFLVMVKSSLFFSGSGLITEILRVNPLVKELKLKSRTLSFWLT